MLEVLSRRIKRNLVAPRVLELQAETYQEIVSEMLRGDEICHPSERWEVDSLFDKSPEKKESPSFTDMMPAWVGGRAEVPVTREVFDEYAGFLETIDELGLLPAHFPNGAFTDDSGLLVCDLGSIIDLNLVVRYLAPGITPPVRILEVGGGYGRLAEAFINVFGDQVSYYLLDAVPLSVYYSQRYLEENLPGTRVVRVGDGDDVGIDGTGCHILPCWHLEKAARLRFDVCINVASMQEMTDQQVNFYLKLFDRQTKDGGVIYLSNSRDYVYQREYYYPKRWKLIDKLITPRSYSPDYPIEIFRRGTSDYSSANTAVDLVYRIFVCNRYRQEIVRLKKIIQNNREQLENLRKRIDLQSNALHKLKAATANNTNSRNERETIERLRKRIAEQQRTIKVLHERSNTQKAKMEDLKQIKQKQIDQQREINRTLRERITAQNDTIKGLLNKYKKP